MAVAWAAVAGANALPKRILLIPVDDRPAVTQFPEMIATMAGVDVVAPPAEILGRFTQPGKPEMILAWLGEQDISRFDAMVVSTDMIAYGGLVASRTDRTSYNLAIQRLRSFWRVRQKHPEIPLYAFASITRVAPTSTAANRDWRDLMARLAELRVELAGDTSQATRQRLANLRARIPSAEIERYDRVRDRNLRVNVELLRMTQLRAFDYLLVGEDDAKPIGPQKPERARLRSAASNLQLGSKVGFAAGIDQVANLLMSRALLTAAEWKPRIRIVYADEQGRFKVASYESLPVEQSLLTQIDASGGVVAAEGEPFDYSLYLNTPDPDRFDLDAFLGSLKSEVDQGFPVAVADVNLGNTGVADERLYSVLLDQGRSARLLAYAGWNTAGNTMGTTIPAANVYLLARRERDQVDALDRELALRTFLLHRLINDFEYHKFVRPEAYRMMDTLPGMSREESYGPGFEKVQKEVSAELTERLTRRFDEQIKGTRFFAGNQLYEVTGLKDIRIGLPWPRAYEVRLDFELVVTPVEP